MKRKGKQPQGASERKAAPMSVLEIENEREVVALNAVFGNVDDGRDILWPGSFTKTLQEHWHRVKALWQHDSWEPPIGTPVWAKEIGADELPPEVKTRFPQALGGLVSKIAYLETPRGDEVLKGIKARAITENSIGYDAIKFDFEEMENERRVRNLREVKLWDLSPVNWGMNPGALVMGFKALGFQDLPLGKVGMEWNGGECLERVRAWASEGGEMNWERYKRAFVLVDEGRAEQAEGYKLLIGDVVEGELMASPLGVMAAGMSVVMGEIEGEDEVAGVKEYLGGYYQKMGLAAPWDEAAVWDLVTAALKVDDVGELKSVVQGLTAMGMVSGENAICFQSAAKLLSDLVEATSEPMGEGEPGQGSTHEGASLGVLRDRFRFLELELGV